MDYDKRFFRREFILSAYSGLASLILANPLEGSFSKDKFIERNVETDIQKSIHLRTIYSRHKIILNYEEWKTLVENPDSLNGKNALLKSRKISSLDETRLLNLMTKQELRDYKIFRDTFEIDIAKLRDKLSDNKEEFMDLVFPIILDMQIELEKTYKTTFNYTNPNPGDYVLWFFHFKHAGTYQAKEGKTLLNYLSEKQKELEKEESKKH